MTEAVFHGDHSPSLHEPFDVGSVQWLRRNDDGGRPQLAAGIWNITPAQAPETFDLTIEEDETLYVISGHLRIEVLGGDSFELVGGSMASFNKGAKTRWTVVEPTVEFFVYS